jgi:hypothetical protein
LPERSTDEDSAGSRCCTSATEGHGRLDPAIGATLHVHQ